MKYYLSRAQKYMCSIDHITYSSSECNGEEDLIFLSDSDGSDFSDEENKLEDNIEQ
jgi:hypothetical protein